MEYILSSSIENKRIRINIVMQHRKELDIRDKRRKLKT